MPASAEDTRWMRQAIALGQRGLGTTWPNPAVGCVLVRGGRVLARGWTAPGGRPHAEAMALSGADARGATAYVSLEPCAHQGQTGPCSAALIEAGVARVVIGCTDPDPRVAGRGIAALEAAGIPVATDVCLAEAWAAQAGFLSRVQRGRPWLTLKLAVSLDGRIALGNGQSQWITGPDARAYAHGLRAIHDAVMIGAGTARADNPSLDLRHGVTSPRPPVRIVVDPSLSLDLTSKLVATAAAQPLWLIHGREAARERRGVMAEAGAELIEIGGDDTGALRMGAALEALAAHGLTRVLCEGGGRLAAALMRAGLVDEIVTIAAGKAIGGDGVPGIAALGLSALDAAPRYDLVETRALGGDVALRWLSRATAAPGA